MGQIEANLAELGIRLPNPSAPIANYLPFARSGSLLVISGQICTGLDGQLSDMHRGKLGAEISLVDGQAAARLCAINVLAQAKAALGDLDAIVQCVRLGGFINALPNFAELATVMNGASDVMVMAFGDKGRHARSTIGVAQLPRDAAVEVEAFFEVA